MVSGPIPKHERHFRELLESRRAAVAGDIRNGLIDSDSQHHVDRAGQAGDLEDRALADLLIDESLADIHRHIRELRAIDAALLRLAEGRYGECPDCGDAIDPRRLEAHPAALRCVDCQERFERTHGHAGHPTL